MTIINKERNYWELKKALEWRKFEEVTLKKSIWLKKVKKTDIDEVIKRNEIIKNSLKYQI